MEFKPVRVVFGGDQMTLGRESLELIFNFNFDSLLEVVHCSMEVPQIFNFGIFEV